MIGFGTAAWAPLVPFVKERAGLGEDGLGLLLLCLGIGSLLGMPAAGGLTTRIGFRPVILAGTLALALSLPGLASFSSVWALAGALALFGAGMGAVDCAMNLQAIVVERERGRPMMSGFHGLYSLGCILGSALFSLLLALRMTAGGAASLIALGLAAAGIAALPGVLGRARSAGGPAFARPRGAVLVLGLLCFVVFLTEGAALDWFALFLRDVRGVDPALAGLGLAAFSVTMTAGRFAGDALVQRLGGRLIVGAGGLLGALGLLVVVAVPGFWAALLGYGLVGAGCANVVPVLFTAAGRLPEMPASVAVPAVTTMGYAGILAGPAAIGVVAGATSLSAAFLLVAALLLAVAVAARVARL